MKDVKGESNYLLSLREAERDQAARPEVGSASSSSSSRFSAAATEERRMGGFQDESPKLASSFGLTTAAVLV